MPIRDINFLHLGLRVHSVGSIDCEFCPTSGRTRPYKCDEPGCAGIIHFEQNDNSYSQISGARYILRCDVAACAFNTTIRGI